MAKSTRAVVFLPKVIEADTGIQVMPLIISDEDLKAKVSALGELSLGVVPYKAGCALRYLRVHEKEVKTILNDKLTAICGIDLMLADTQDGTVYIVRNVCKSYDAPACARAMNDKIDWQVRVEHINDRARYYNDITVFSKHHPPTWNPRMMDVVTGQYQPVTITEKQYGTGELRGINRMRSFKPTTSPDDDMEWHTQPATGRPPLSSTHRAFPKRDKWSDADSDHDENDDYEEHEESNHELQDLQGGQGCIAESARSPHAGHQRSLVACAENQRV